VLAFVMSLKAKGSAAGLHTDSRRRGDVPDGARLKEQRRRRRRRTPSTAPAA
jgi:hypothetical protein